MPRKNTQQQQPRRRQAGATSPTLPAVLLLILFAFVMATVAPVNFNRILHKLLPFLPSDKPVLSEQDARVVVWVAKQSGLYYCSDSGLYGQGTGDFLPQGEALELGYQPALTQYCHETPGTPRPAGAPASKPRRSTPPRQPAPIPPPPDIE